LEAAAVAPEVKAPDRQPTPSAAANGAGGNLDCRIRAYLDKIPSGVQGQHGSNPTYHAAQVLVNGFGLSPDEARPYMDEYTARCQPPWSEREITHKLEDAYKRGDGKGRARGYLLDQSTTPRGVWKGRPHEANGTSSTPPDAEPYYG